MPDWSFRILVSAVDLTERLVWVATLLLALYAMGAATHWVWKQR